MQVNIETRNNNRCLVTQPSQQGVKITTHGVRSWADLFLTDGDRSWADLPNDILSSIAERLTKADLISFRKTCKNFSCASSTASAKVACTFPLLLYRHGPDSKEYTFRDLHKSKTYNKNLPDLEDAICLASYNGWMLLFKDKSIFFFSPFSLAKIALPDFPNKQIDDHVGAFTDIPTSPRCTISIFKRIDDNVIKINMISKGQTMWTQRKVMIPRLGSHINVAEFDHKSQTFYYIDNCNFVLKLSKEDTKWVSYRVNVKQHNLIKGTRSTRDKDFVTLSKVTYKEGDVKITLYARDLSLTKTSRRQGFWIQPRFFEADPNHQW